MIDIRERTNYTKDNKKEKSFARLRGFFAYL